MQASSPASLAAASLAAAVSATPVRDPFPSGRRSRYVLVFDSTSCSFLWRRKRRQALQDDRRGQGLFDAELNVLWHPHPGHEKLPALRHRLIERYPYFAAFWQLGLQGGLEAASDSVAQAALWIEEIARAIRYRLNTGESISAATGRPVASVVPADLQEAIQDFLGQVTAMMERTGLGDAHPADARRRSVAAVLGINPDEPGWTDALPWAPVRHLEHGRTIEDLARTYGVTEPHQVIYLTAVARAVLDDETVTLGTPLNGYAYARVDVVMRLILQPLAVERQDPDLMAREVLNALGPYLAP